MTFKKGFGFHPLGAWCANTAESLAMLLREGNAGSNTVSDHIRVLADARAARPDPGRGLIDVLEGKIEAHAPRRGRLMADRID